MSRRGPDLPQGRLADDWSAIALTDSRRRVSTPFSLSVVPSMPVNTDAATVRDAARAFAREVFADRFDYAFALGLLGRRQDRRRGAQRVALRTPRRSPAQPVMMKRPRPQERSSVRLALVLNRAQG